MEYVNERIQKIPIELENAPNKQAMLDRLRSSKSFANLGSAKYYRFESTGVHNGEKESWFREQLTRHDALRDFEITDNCCLWYAPLLRTFVSRPLSFP
jgi:hypothetical protein